MLWQYVWFQLLYALAICLVSFAFMPEIYDSVLTLQLYMELNLDRAH